MARTVPAFEAKVLKALEAIDARLGVLEGAPKPTRSRARVSGPKAPVNGFYESVIKARVGCAYGVAKCGRFAPNGVGSRQHTTCPKGRAALAAR